MEPQRAGRLWWRLACIAGVLAMAAFAAWGAFGAHGGAYGVNGPLFIGSYGLDGGPGNGKQPLGIIIPISSKAHATILIDGIRLIGGVGYPPPRPFALRVIAYNQCAGAWPLRRTGHTLVLDGCGAHDLGPLISHRVHFGTYQSEMVAEVWPPRPRSCWVLTHVAVRFHIGAQHFSAIYPDATVTCEGIATTIERTIMQQAAEEAVR
ncbi:MAG TPA: hypothetical protein VF834_22545 [Streptosporangiaceae bacterium]